jgi:phosphonate transport system substrate-binding protein
MRPRQCNAPAALPKPAAGRFTGKREEWFMKRLVSLCLGCVLFCTTLAARAAEPYILSLVPGAPPVTMSKVWTPLIERLQQDTGLEFRLRLFDRMAEFERDIWSGAPDFIFGSPIQTVIAHQSHGYMPLVRNSVPVDIGLYVRKDSPIRTIDDLMGKKISFVGNKNVCSVYIQHQLMNYGKKLEFEREYAGSSRNVLLNVLLGKVDAGSVFTPELLRESDETRSQLRLVVATPRFAPHPIAAHPRLPPAVRTKVKQALLAIAADPQGAALLKPMALDKLTEADYGRDYRELERIDIKGLTNWGE